MNKAEGTVAWRRVREILLLSTNASSQDTDKMELDSSWRHPTKGQETVCICWNMGNSDSARKNILMMKVIKHNLPEEVREPPSLEVFMNLDKALRNLII